MINKNENIIIIGICGCSRCGKTKLTKELIQQYINLNQLNIDAYIPYSSIHLDKYFNREKISKNLIKTSKGHTYRNWEFPGALDWDDFLIAINKQIKEMSENIKDNKKGILIIEGYLLFSPEFEKYKAEVNNYLNILDYYIYICLDKSIAKERRMKTTKVGNDYYDEILWPEHIKYCTKYIQFFKYLKENNKNILIIDGNKQYDSKKVAICILKWIKVLKNCDNDCNSLYNILFTPIEDQLNLLKKNFNK